MEANSIKEDALVEMSCTNVKEYTADISRVSQRKDQTSVFVKSGGKLIKAAISTILFAHTDSKNYCSLVTTDHKKLLVKNFIYGLLKLLNTHNFVQTHRSYIINWEKINAVHESDQTLEIRGHHIPLVRTFKRNVYKRLHII